MRPEVQVFALWSGLLLSAGLVVGWWLGRRFRQAPDTTPLETEAETRYTEAEVIAEAPRARMVRWHLCRCESLTGRLVKMDSCLACDYDHALECFPPHPEDWFVVSALGLEVTGPLPTGVRCRCGNDATRALRSNHPRCESCESRRKKRRAAS